MNARRIFVLVVSAALTACIDFQLAANDCKDGGVCLQPDGGSYIGGSTGGGEATGGGGGVTGGGGTVTGGGGGVTGGGNATGGGGGDVDAGPADSGVPPLCVNGFCFEHPYPNGIDWVTVSPVSSTEAWLGAGAGWVAHVRGKEFEYSVRGTRMAFCFSDDGYSFNDAQEFFAPNGTQISSSFGTLTDFACQRLVHDEAQPLQLWAMGYSGSSRLPVIISVQTDGAQTMNNIVFDDAGASGQSFDRTADGGLWLITDGGVRRVEFAPSFSVGPPLLPNGSWQRPNWVDSSDRFWLSAGGNLKRYSLDGGVESGMSITTPTWLGGLDDTAFLYTETYGASSFRLCAAPSNCATTPTRSFGPYEVNQLESMPHAVWLAGKGGAVARYSDAGFEELTAGTRRDIAAILALPDGGGWAIDTDNKVLERVGARWVLQQTRVALNAGHFQRTSAGEWLLIGDTTSSAPLMVQFFDDGRITDLNNPLSLTRRGFGAEDWVVDLSGRAWKREGLQWVDKPMTPLDGGVVEAFTARSDELWLAGLQADGGRALFHGTDAGWAEVVTPPAVLGATPAAIVSQRAGEAWVLFVQGSLGSVLRVTPADGGLTLLDVEGAQIANLAWELSGLPDGGIAAGVVGGISEFDGNRFQLRPFPIDRVRAFSSAGPLLLVGGTNGSILSH